ncbi:plasmid mobilization protein [Streptomyces sp. H39-C1]|uniref:plasmid mobilization protein n=1 Tax=Streptomyces sp. H39-C1 TaxID=3004355 RepID=UPI0022AF5FFA|nr:plasmid mobilization relaxosome protein MobC [Streptomyces sp. H39-C1]MCZ4103047.1 plasmid mobilization relaxosome protein MobC [Streptomyces sp. H39-C1]
MREINSTNTSTSAPHSGVEVTDASVPTTCGASKSLRPPYGRSQAQAPAQGGGGGPAGAPDLELVAAEGSRDQDLQPPSQRTATCQQPPVVRASATAAARRKPKRRQRDATQKKKSRVTVRFDQHEKQQLDDQAATAGLSLAHLVARRALTPGTATAGSVQRTEQLDAAIDELASTRAELSAWGNNLNQIARHLNTGGTLVPGPASQFVDSAGYLLGQDLPRVVALLDEAAHRIAKRRGRG